MSIEKNSAIVAIDGSVVVIIIVASGALAARYKILDHHGAESLSKLILNVLLPALLFTEMIKSLDISKLTEFGLLFFFCTGKMHLAHVFIGLAVGWVMATLTSAEKNIKRLIMGCIAFQDTTAIPLIFAQVLGNSEVTNSDSNFKSDAISFVLVYTVFVTVYKWSVAYGYELFSLMKSDLGSHEEKIEVNASVMSYEPIIPVNKGWFWTLKKIMNPPIYATLISIPFGLIPYMKEYVFCGSGAVLTGNAFAALTTMGSTVSPLICVLLGTKLSDGYPPSANISNLHIALILIGKEVIMPLVGLGLVGLFYWYDIIDRVLTVTVWIIYAGPTSLQLLMICTAHQNQVDNISKMYLFMYGTAAIPMALWTMGFLILVY